MRTKVTLILIFLNVALFGFIFYVRPKFDIEEKIKATRTRVLGPAGSPIERNRMSEVTSGRSAAVSRADRARSSAADTSTTAARSVAAVASSPATGVTEGAAKVVAASCIRVGQLLVLAV